MIPVASPLAQTQTHRTAIDAAVARVIESGSYILGDEVASFEAQFAAYCQTEHAVGVGSGTDALILTLKAMGIGAGDEVIAVSHTALATVAALLASGATPVLVDVDANSRNIDPARVEEAVTDRTRAIVAVHLYGMPSDLDALATLAARHGLKLIEDCAQAAGACWRGRPVGGIGDAGCFSFYPTKNLGALGDGGMVTTQDAALAERLRRLRQYGWNAARATEEPGLNSRLDPLQAAILGVKLPYLDADNVRRNRIARDYAEGLNGLPLELPSADPRAHHVFHLYVVATDRRDELVRWLANEGVGTAVHYPVPAHRHGGYAERVRLPQDGLPVTERLAGRIVSLPMFPELAARDIARVIEAVRRFFHRT